MWRLRTLVILGTLVAALVVGATVAYGSWWWNAHLDVEGVEVRTAWTVPDDPEGANNYGAVILVRLPMGANAEIIEVADNEIVTIQHTPALSCYPNGIEAKVTYVVQGNDAATGSYAEVWVTGDGHLLGSNQGPLGTPIKVRVIIPGTCSGYPWSAQ